MKSFIIYIILISILLKYSNSFITQIRENPVAIFKIFIYLIIAIVIFGAIFVYKYKEYIASHWEKYRCKPYVMPFAGRIRRTEDQTIGEATRDNFDQCTTLIGQQLAEKFLTPFVFIMKKFNEILEGIRVFLKNLRDQVKHINGFMANLMESMSTRYDRMMHKSILYSAKLNNVLKKQLALYKYLHNLATSLNTTTTQLWKGNNGVGGIKKENKEAHDLLVKGNSWTLKKCKNDSIKKECKEECNAMYGRGKARRQCRRKCRRGQR